MNIEVFNKSAGTQELVIRSGEDDQEVQINDEFYTLHPSAYKAIIVQPTTGTYGDNKELYKGKKGTFFFEEVDFAEAELNVLPIAILYRHMTWFNEPFNSAVKQRPACWSVDCITPAKRVLSPVSDVCHTVSTGADGNLKFTAVCPNAQWVEVGSGMRRACSESIAVALLAFEQNAAPIFIEFKGTSAGAFNKFIREYSKIRKESRFKKKAEGSIAASDYYINIKLEDAGNYFKPVFTRVAAPELKLGKFAPLIDHYVSTVYRQLVDAATEDLNPVEEVIPALAGDTPDAELASVSVETADGGEFSLDD